MDTTRLVAATGILLVAGSLTSCGVVRAAASPFIPHETFTAAPADPVPAPTATAGVPTPNSTPAEPSATSTVSKSPAVVLDTPTLQPYSMGTVGISAPASYRMQEITNAQDRKDGLTRVDGGAVGDLTAPDVVALVFHRPAPAAPPSTAQVQATLDEVAATVRALPETALRSDDADLPHGCTGVRTLTLEPTRGETDGLRFVEDSYTCASAKSRDGQVRVWEVSAIDSAGGIHVLRLSASTFYLAEHPNELQQVFTSMVAKA